MALPRIIPILTLDNRRLVKTKKFKKPVYIGDPLNAVKIFNTKEVDELVLLDITCTVNKKQPNFELIKNIAGECFMPLSYGGGVDSLEKATRIFKSGVEKIIVNTLLKSGPKDAEEIGKKYGTSSLVASIDVRKSIFGKYEVYTNGGKLNTKQNPVVWAQRAENLGVGEIIITSIDNDGLMNGYNIDLIKKVSDSVSIPVVANGGLGKFEDIINVFEKTSINACSGGSFFVYKGKHRAVLISYPDEKQIRLLNDVD